MIWHIVANIRLDLRREDLRETQEILTPKLSPFIQPRFDLLWETQILGFGSQFDRKDQVGKKQV